MADRGPDTGGQPGARAVAEHRPAVQSGPVECPVQRLAPGQELGPAAGREPRRELPFLLVPVAARRPDGVHHGQPQPARMTELRFHE
ncbi:hypothetical protein [Kitasatospora sp. NPDC015120]|uniref:hypothetical protein n=1 Tax=Kitasatospora sp. NPDC015120 TaxID=3364023 RepID=UPI0036F4957E